VDWKSSVFTCIGGLEEHCPHLQRWNGRALSSHKEMDWKSTVITCRSGLEELCPQLQRWTGRALSSPAEVDWKNSILTCRGGLEELCPHLQRCTKRALSSPAEVDWTTSVLTCRGGLEELYCGKERLSLLPRFGLDEARPQWLPLSAVRQLFKLVYALCRPFSFRVGGPAINEKVND